MTNAVSPQLRDLTAAAIALTVGAYALFETGEMSELGRVFPFTAGIVAIFGGLALAVIAALRRHVAEAGTEEERTDWPRFAAAALVLTAWALLLDPLGLIASSAMAMLALALIARREVLSAQAALLHLAAGGLLIGGFYVLLSFLLRVPMP